MGHCVTLLCFPAHVWQTAQCARWTPHLPGLFFSRQVGPDLGVPSFSGQIQSLNSDFLHLGFGLDCDWEQIEEAGHWGWSSCHCGVYALCRWTLLDSRTWPWHILGLPGWMCQMLFLDQRMPYRSAFDLGTLTLGQLWTIWRSRIIEKSKWKNIHTEISHVKSPKLLIVRPIEQIAFQGLEYHFVLEWWHKSHSWLFQNCGKYCKTKTICMTRIQEICMCWYE